MENIKLPHSHGQDIESKLDRMPPAENFQTIADIFKQLGDSSRVRIFWLLCHCEECVINISAIVDMTSPAVSHHLSRLKASGLIVNRRIGKEVYYKAANTERAQLLHLMIERLAEVECITPDTETTLEQPDGAPLSENEQSRTETIKNVHAFITENMDKRYTIDELAKRYLMNTTTLKAGFKAMYGLPIASYMKQYRMKQAMRMLRETDESIASIALKVGYESRSKFTEAFKSSAEMLPTEYRELYRTMPR